MRIFIPTEEEPFNLPTFMDKVLRAWANDVMGVAITPYVWGEAGEFSRRGRRFR